MAEHALLSCEGLHCRRGEGELFGGLDLTLRAGEVLRIEGANGSGKTTLLKILAGLMTPDAGSLRWRGEHFDARIDEATQPIAYLGERPGLSRDLSVRENLDWHAALAQVAPDRVTAAMALFGLQALQLRLVRRLSTGQIKRTALARLAISRARLWLLDEPFNGLDAAHRAVVCAALSEHAGGGGCVAIASHDPLEVSAGVVRQLVLGR